MLTHTFVHVPGIGDQTEQRLWALGVVDWECAMQDLPSGVSARCRKCLPCAIEESRQALARRDVAYFAQRLGAAHHWRLYPTFAERAAFLDIETTGLGDSSVITTIAVYDGQSIRTYVRDQNLQEFPADIRQYQLLVTYNGKCFDVPFLERGFRMRLPQPQIDLRYVLAALGYKGGLKNCEHLLGIPRPEALQEVDGFMAVQLWRAHIQGDRRALPALLRYNIEDAVNLQWLMETAYNLAIARLPVPLSVAQIPVCTRPRIDWPFDPGIIQELLGPRPFETHWSRQPRRW
jgi:uncharacterized protein